MNVERLITDNLSRVRIIAGNLLRSWCVSFSDWDDLIAAGNLGLVKAAHRYDESRGAFSTYSAYKIKGAMKDYLLWKSPSFPLKSCTIRLRREDLLTNDSSHADLINRLTLDNLLGQLRPRDEQIIRLLYLCDKTGIEVAATVGVSGSRISQLERAAMRQLVQSANPAES